MPDPTHVYVFSTEWEEGMGSLTQVHKIFLSREKAEAYKLAHDTLELPCHDGSTHFRNSNPIEAWPLADNDA